MGCVMEIWIIYRRIGTYIVPDVWTAKIPEPLYMVQRFPKQPKWVDP